MCNSIPEKKTLCESSSTKEIQSVKKAFAILEYLSFRHEPCRLSDISHALRMPSCTILRFLGTLIHMGYVSQEISTGKYFITMKICNISEKLVQNLRINDIAEPYIKELSSRCGSTVCLAIEKNRKVIYEEIMYSVNDKSLRSIRRIGQIVPYHCTDVGKIFLLSKTKKQINRLIHQDAFVHYTPHTIVSHAQLQTEIAFAHKNHFTIDNEEYSDGISAFAVPIHNYTGHIVAALSICGFTKNLTPKLREQYLPMLQTAAADIADCMGYSTGISI